MQVQLLPSDTRIQPGVPVEQLYMVDGKTLAVQIDWRMIEVFVAGASPTPEAVASALAVHRQSIERIVRAHLFAQGFPLSAELALTPSDFGADQQ